MSGTKNLNRRQLLKAMGMAAGGGAVSMLPSQLRAQEQDDPYFLIVLSGTGGASLIDSFLAIRESESNDPQRLNIYQDSRVQDIAGSPFRAIDTVSQNVGALPTPFRANQSDFVKKHHQDMAVVTVTGTSVNHAVAQKRALTGNEAWAGRTIQELVAYQYGKNSLLPNVVMPVGTAYINPGTDTSLPEYCRAETVANPALWPLSLHGSRGLSASSPDFIKMARKIRDEKLDPSSKFSRIFTRSSKLSAYKRQRGKTQGLEDAELISKLMLFANSDKYPLTNYGLTESADGRLVRETFPNFAVDPAEAQAALAFLLLKNQVSVSVTLGPNFNVVLADGASLQGQGLKEGDLINPPIGFDFSHQAHRATQALMWNRVLELADGLIELLKKQEFKNGQSYWDRTLIYVATEFGREKVRPMAADDFGTSHHLNNGYLLISPLLKGNRIYGGVDPNTALTYGFDPQTGMPAPGRQMTEAEIFSGLLRTLKIDTQGSGLPSVTAFSKA